MPDEHATRNPWPLMVAALLVAGEGLFFTTYAGLELAHLSGARMAMGLTTSLFFAAWGVGLLICSYALTHHGGWARSPVVLAQGITLLVAWGFRGGDTTWVAATAGSVALAVLVGMLAPSSSRVFADQTS